MPITKKTNLNEIETLVDLVTQSNVSQVILIAGTRRVMIRNGPAGVHPARAHYEDPAIHEEPAEAVSEEAEVMASSIFQWITAPMVGIFHPAVPPVTAGDPVSAGQTVGVIESMKLMNDIVVEAAGVIRAIVIEAEHAVEYGQPLFELEAI